MTIDHKKNQDILKDFYSMLFDGLSANEVNEQTKSIIKPKSPKKPNNDSLHEMVGVTDE